MRKIVVAFDHAGFDLRETVIKTIRECGCEVIDVGTDSSASVDFPDYAYLGTQKILDGEAERGVFVCGSGIGMSLAASKRKGIYAAVCHDVYSAHQAVEHDDMNVLCLGSRVIGSEAARELIQAYLGASFNQKPNQIRRMEKIRRIEDGTYTLTNNAVRLFEKGQSLWLDNIHRGMLADGKLAQDISKGIIRGITSNPTIIRKAISDSDDYDNAIAAMALAQRSSSEIYTQIIVEDIRNAADCLRNLYVESKGQDGYVCLEIDPQYADDPNKSLKEAKRLWKAVNRPNLMIKIPATKACLSVIRELTAAGMNINATLIFSPERYSEAAQAYIDGLNDRIAEGLPIDQVHSAASVFVSRIDSVVDPFLSDLGVNGSELLGGTAIKNAQRIYNRYLSTFSEENFGKLQSKGGSKQRVLWASTSTKNPNYRETYYVDALVGENTVCTVPPRTLKAIMDTENPCKTSLPVDEKEINTFFDKLSKAGIDMQSAYDSLETEGIKAFQRDYLATINSVEEKRGRTIRDISFLGEEILKGYDAFHSDVVMQRIFSKDPNVWTFDKQSFAEIRNRLGWLDTFSRTQTSLPDYKALRQELKQEGIEKILLLGMGGSSLAPEVMARVFDAESDIKLSIIDSTDPLQVHEAEQAHDPCKTLYIVSSKSGGTAEVRAFLDYFYAKTIEAVGSENAGKHFIAITDPATSLEKTAKELNFRNIFLADSSVGGRFSALTAFGMVPAVLMGLDPEKIAANVAEISKICSASMPSNRNEGAALGGFIGIAALQGVDKLTILTDKELESFGSWLEQLIAESSGKEGKGIIPIDLEPYSEIIRYAKDRCFVYVNLTGSRGDIFNKLREQGYPVFEIKLHEKYNLFAEFYRWEIAIAVACHFLNVNAFDQPNVQDSKTRTVAKINDYHEKGSLTELPAVWEDETAAVYAPENQSDFSDCSNYESVIAKFVSTAEPGTDYVAINAYLPRNEKMTLWLQQLRKTILQNTGCATTLGFGPRFQHSTGQLHKGGQNHGLFIQIVADYNEDYEIPNENLSFSVLERAQALGDLESLESNQRRLIRIRFKNGLSRMG